MRGPKTYFLKNGMCEIQPECICVELTPCLTFSINHLG